MGSRIRIPVGASGFQEEFLANLLLHYHFNRLSYRLLLSVLEHCHLGVTWEVITVQVVNSVIVCIQYSSDRTTGCCDVTTRALVSTIGLAYN